MLSELKPHNNRVCFHCCISFIYTEQLILVENMDSKLYKLHNKFNKTTIFHVITEQTLVHDKTIAFQKINLIDKYIIYIIYYIFNIFK